MFISDGIDSYFVPCLKRIYRNVTCLVSVQLNEHAHNSVEYIFIHTILYESILTRKGNSGKKKFLLSEGNLEQDQLMIGELSAEGWLGREGEKGDRAESRAEH